MLTQEKLKEVLNYDEHTGTFTYKIRRGRCAVGSTAGTTKPGKQVHIRIDGTQHYASRLAYIYMLGKLPEGNVKFKDLDNQNTSWSNISPLVEEERLPAFKLAGVTHAEVEEESFDRANLYKDDTSRWDI